MKTQAPALVDAQTTVLGFRYQPAGILTFHLLHHPPGRTGPDSVETLARPQTGPIQQRLQVGRCNHRNLTSFFAGSRKLREYNWLAAGLSDHAGLQGGPVHDFGRAGRRTAGRYAGFSDRWQASLTAAFFEGVAGSSAPGRVVAGEIRQAAIKVRARCRYPRLLPCPANACRIRSRASPESLGPRVSVIPELACSRRAFRIRRTCRLKRLQLTHI
jgi:hypothetical protein